MADEKDYTDSIRAGKPKSYTGGFSVAPKGTPVPTKEAPFAALNAAFKPGGFVGEDGVKRKSDSKEEDEKAWGGVIINTLRTDFGVSYELELYCCGDPDILRMVFGPDNVEVVGDTVIVYGNEKMAPRQAVVFDMLDKGLGEREVIENAQILANGDETFTHKESKKIQIEIKAYPNKDGNSYVNYKELAAGTGSTAPLAPSGV